MKPYFVDERAGIMIYHGDALEVLPELPPDSADLLVTDPPYGVKWDSGCRRAQPFGQMAGDENEACGMEGILLTLRLLRRHRHLYVFGRWKDLKTLPISDPVELIWDKANTGLGNLSSPWGVSHEYIQFSTSPRSSANIKRGDGRLASRMRKGSVLRHLRPNAAAVRHPAEKPVGLLRELIESSSCIGETVLDPFSGSGSTLVAAKLEGRCAIGIEIEERWCEMAAKRLSGEISETGEAHEVQENLPLT